ncbi:uncharacterized protein LOC133918627 [Phragmites australis]|uniref:uncharacterized protein LOC133918627 n=1 Tax=Phragmites australis TaxID=29695 RepID=UPI002D78E437|nr:uncharacterized protein LOC133918627 [Phragmites australis]
MSSQQLMRMDEALHQQPANRPTSEDRNDHGFSLLTLMGFAFLTFNSGMALYKSNGDLAAITFVGFSYLLVVLFYFLRWYERTPPESPRRELSRLPFAHPFSHHGDLEEARASPGMVTPPRDRRFFWLATAASRIAVEPSPTATILTAMAFAILTFNSGMAIYRSQGDSWAVAFGAFTYLDLILLIYCLRLFGRVDDPSFCRVKASVWVLTALLATMFAWKVVTVMPLALAVMVGGMAGAAVLGCFYAFFVHRETTSSHPARA